MKKTITKLALRKETIRALVDAELPRVIGGDDATACPGATITELASGCRIVDAYILVPRGIK